MLTLAKVQTFSDLTVIINVTVLVWLFLSRFCPPTQLFLFKK